MGTWGVGPFDNDTAGDWIDALVERKSVRPIATAISRVRKTTRDSDIEFVGIAAAEVIAAARGRATDANEEISSWLREREYVPDEALVNRARALIESLIDKSEVAELFADDPDWKRAMRRLVRALAAPAKPPGKQAGKKTKPRQNPRKAAGSAAARRSLKGLHCVVYPERGGAITSISCHSMHDVALESVVSTSSQSLESVCIDDGAALSDAGVASLQACRNLKKLRLTGAPGITDAAFLELRGLTSLETLELSRCEGITGAALASFVECRALRRLELEETPIDDAFAAEIARLPSLEQLWARKTGLTDRGLQLIAHQHTKLRKLFLARTPITDRGLKPLTDLPDLVWLDLKGTQITDQGVRTLTACPSLQALDLSRTQITDKCIDALAKLDLCYLAVSETGISEEGLGRLEESLPRLSSDAWKKLM